jgi:type IV conjugative transfer system coupling protein TraD
MTISRNDKRHQFTRGAEVMRHEYGLYFSALFFSFMIAVLTAFGTWVFVANAALSDDEGQIILGRVVAEYNVRSGTPQDKVKLVLTRAERQKTFIMPAESLLKLTTPEWENIRHKLWICSWFSLGAGFSLFMLTNWAWRQFGKKVSKDEVVRGSVFAEPKSVAKELESTGTASKIRFADVPIEAGREVLNFGVSGSVGSGKSVAIANTLDDIRAEGRRAVVFDSTGEFIEGFYREGIDTILNPFDERSPDWKPWNEVRRPYDYANLAESFVPVMNRREPFWEEGAQAVLEDILSRLAKNNQATNRRLVEVVNVLTLKEIQAIVKKLPGAVYMDPDAAKTALGIRMNVVRAAKAMRYMGDGGAETQFSIRNWVNDDSNDSWLFLSTKEEMLTTMRPLLTAWFDIAVRSVLALPKSRNRLIFGVVDELTSLNRISTLKEAATRGRKYGLALLLGYQNIAQAREVYGDNDAQTIISMLQNRLALLVPDHETAKYVSQNLGDQEVLEKDENISFGVDSTRDGVTISTRREPRILVLASEIQGLAPMNGYLRLAGRNEVMKVTFSYRDRLGIAAPFIEREVTSYALDE